MDGFQDDADSLRGSGGRMILKMGFRTLTSPKRSADRDKNEPSRFLGDGVSFRAKLIGILEVGEARGERMCQEALADLKMAVRAAGEHKQRIVVCVAIDGLRLRDDKTGDCLYHHPVHKISFIAQDMTDSRAFGYIFGSPDTGHRFFGIKTDKAASQVVIAMRDLFQVVFELKKKEIEMAKQHIEQQQLKYCSSGTSKFSDTSSKESGDQGKMRPIAEDQQENGGTSGGRGSSCLRRHTSSSAAVVAISPPPRHPNALHHQQQQQTSEVIADLLDLEIELSSIQAGIHQMEKMTPSDPFGPGATTPSAIPSLRPPSLPALPDMTLSPTVSVEDPFGDSFVGPTNIPTALPPPPSNAATSISIPMTSSSLSTQGCKGQRPIASEPPKGTSGGIAESSWFERPLGSEDLFGEVLPPVGDSGAGREQEKGNLNGSATQTSIGVGDFSSGKGLVNTLGEDMKGSGAGGGASGGGASQFDVFTELDPLGTGRSRPYVDKKDFFQELKNPPKKVLRDLVSVADPSAIHSSPSAASSLASAPAIGASPAAVVAAPTSASFCSSTATAPLFHAMFDAGEGSQVSSDLFTSADLFFPPSTGAAISLSAAAHSASKGLTRNVEGIFPAPTTGSEHSSFAAAASPVLPTPSSLVSCPSTLANAADPNSLAAEDPFADTDPFADEDSAPVPTSLSDVDVAGIFPRIEDDPFDTGFADFTTLSIGTSRRKRAEQNLSASATLGRRPRSSKGITHGPLRVSLPPEKGASKASLESPVLLPPPPSGDLGGFAHSTGTVPRSRSRSPRLPRQASTGGVRVPSPKSLRHHHRMAGGPMVARTPSEGAYSSSPQSPPEPPPRPPSSVGSGTKPPPLPPKRVAVGPMATAGPPAPLRLPFPDDDDEDNASQYEFINQYETSRPSSSPSGVETKGIARTRGTRKLDVGLPPPPRRQHQRASPSSEPTSAEPISKQSSQTIPTLLPPPQSTTGSSRSSPLQSGSEAGEPTSGTPSFDLTLAELGRMSIADLASALRIPPERVSTMTLQELAEMLSASRSKVRKSPERTLSTSREEGSSIKRDRYAALRESVDDESIANSANFNADFDGKFDNDFVKEEGPKILDDVFREAPFDKYAVFRELIESEADGNEKADELNEQTVPTEEETGSVEAVEEGRVNSPMNDVSVSDLSKEGDACSPSRAFEGQIGEQTDDKETVSVTGKEEEEESSREETEATDKYAALREICLMGEKEDEAGASGTGEVNSSEERNGKVPTPPVAKSESPADKDAVDLLVLSRQPSEAPEEEQDEIKAESPPKTAPPEESFELTAKETIAVESTSPIPRPKGRSSSEKENAGWANFETEAAEKAMDAGESEEAVSPWSSEGREAVGWVAETEGAWGSETRRERPPVQSKQKAAMTESGGGYGGAKGATKWAGGGGAYRGRCRWRERRACVEDEEEEEEEDEEEEDDLEEEEEERRGRRGRTRRARRSVSPWAREEEEAPRRRIRDEPTEEAWARRTAGRGTCWEGPPSQRRARPPPLRTRKPSTWGDEEDEGEEDDWPQQQPPHPHRATAYERRVGEEEEGGERWRTKKRRGRRRTGSAEWDAEGEDEGEEEEEEGEEERGGRWRGPRRQGGASWGEEEEEGGWGGAWGAEGGRVAGTRHRGTTRGRSYRSWDEEDEAEEDYREGDGRWAMEDEVPDEGGERRRRRVRTASGESGASSRSAAQYPRHFRYEQEDVLPSAGRGRERGREREGGAAQRRRTAAPSGPSGQRKSATARWQQQQWREEEEEEGEAEGRWGRRVAPVSASSTRGGGSGTRRGRQRGKEASGGGGVVKAAARTPSRGSSGGRLQSPFEDDFVHAAGGGSSVSSDVSESRRSPVAAAVHNGRGNDDVFLPCEGELADGTAFPFPSKATRVVDPCSAPQRPFSAPVEGVRHHSDQRTPGPRDRVTGTVPLSRSVHRTQRQSGAELGNGSIRKSESVNIFARDSDPFDDDFFSSGGNSCGEKGRMGCGPRQSSVVTSDPFKWTEPFDHFEFREEEEEEEEDEEEEVAAGGRGRCREREGATAAEGTN